MHNQEQVALCSANMASSTSTRPRYGGRACQDVHVPGKEKHDLARGYDNLIHTPSKDHVLVVHTVSITPCLCAPCAPAPEAALDARRGIVRRRAMFTCTCPPSTASATVGRYDNVPTPVGWACSLLRRSDMANLCLARNVGPPNGPQSRSKINNAPTVSCITRPMQRRS